MKKASIFILSSVVLALAALYVISLFVDEAKNPWVRLGLGKNNEPASPGVVPKDYSKVKKQVTLHREQELYPLETELLQRWINLYMGAAVVPVSGLYDEITEKYVTEITGKSSTTLQEMRFVWLVNRQLDKEADAIQHGAA